MEIRFPEHVLEIIEKSAKKYPSDIPKATELAERQIRALDDFEEIEAMLITSAIKEKINDARHITNTRIKNETGQYGGRAKVVSGESNGVLRAAESCYHHRIAGTILGMVLGKELPDIAASEAAIANGHSFNAALAARLKTMVPLESRVQDAVPEKKLRKIMEELRQKMRDGESFVESDTKGAVPIPLGDSRFESEPGAAKRTKQRAAVLAKPR